MNTFSRRGACPALSAPMQTGDGLLVRLNPLDPGLPPGTLAGLCEAALLHGNGVVEVTGRGSLQVRGLTPRSAILFARDVDSLGIRVRTGLAVEYGALAGLDPEETADPRPLAARIAEAAETAGLAPRLGPKVSVVVDGGGRSGLAGVAADVRVTAMRHPDGCFWVLGIGGDATTARPLAALPGDLAAVRAVACLEAVAALGRAGRGRDLDEGQLRRLATALTDEKLPSPLAPPHKGDGNNAIASPARFGDGRMPDETPQFPLLLVRRGDGWGRKGETSRITSAITGPLDERMLVPSILALRDGRSALAVALPFGHIDAQWMIAFAARAEELGASDIRLAPARIILTLCPTEAAARSLRDEAGRLGFLVDAADPRAGVAACPGAPACASGRIPARDLAARIAVAHGDVLDGSLDIHVSGCAKGCAHPAEAALTLVGLEGAVGLIVGGTARGAPLAEVPAKQALESFGRVAGLVRDGRRPGETAAECAARLGSRRLAEAFEKG